MSTTDPYFQFPLHMLAYVNIGERLDTIVDYCLVETGRDFFTKLDTTEHNKVIKAFPAANLPSGFQKSNDWHKIALLGMRALNVKGGSIVRTLELFHKATAFFNNWTNEHGAQPQVRIKTEYLWDVKGNKGMTYREFSMLCAIYSFIGAKNYPVRITRETIQCRMLGYKSQGIMQTHAEGREDGLKPMTLRQINYTLDRLHERKFFSRARANARQTFYSHRLNQEQLEKTLISGKSYSQDFHQRRLERNASLMATIKAGKAAIKVNTPIKVDNTPETDTNEVHSASTTVSTGLSTGVSTIIQTLSNLETPSVETLPIEAQGATALCVGDSESAAKDPEPEIKPFEPKPPSCLEDVASFAAGCVKGSADHVGGFWSMIEQGLVSGDWKRAFVKFSTKRIDEERRRKTYSAMRTALAEEQSQ